MRCPRCGRELPVDSQTCPRCGAERDAGPPAATARVSGAGVGYGIFFSLGLLLLVLAGFVVAAERLEPATADALGSLVGFRLGCLWAFLSVAAAVAGFVLYRDRSLLLLAVLTVALPALAVVVCGSGAMPADTFLLAFGLPYAALCLVLPLLRLRAARRAIREAGG